MRHVRHALLVFMMMATAGCLQSTTTVTVKADGSGTIEEVTTMSAEAIAQMKAFSSMGGEQGKAGASKGPDLFDAAKLKAAASKMGPGVRFVSATPIKSATAEGVKALYAFDDITKVTLDQKPSGMDSMAGMSTSSSGEKEFLLFKFAKSAGGNPVVTVVTPEPKIDKSADKSKTPAAEAPDAAAGVEMMKQFLKGMKIAIALRVDGRIVRTNGQYVSGPQVTLLELDFDKLAADPAALKRVGEPKTLEEAKRLLKGVPGVKFNFEKEMFVEFAGK